MQNYKKFIAKLNETIRYINNNLQQHNLPIILSKYEINEILMNSINVIRKY